MTPRPPESPTKAIRGAMDRMQVQGSPSRGRGTDNRRMPDAGTRNGPPLMEQQAAHLRALIKQWPTPADKNEYLRLVTAWRVKYGNSEPSLVVPFPPSPGTATPGSGECYQCGLTYKHPWGKGRCPNPALPERESNWRAICGRLGFAKKREPAVVQLLEEDPELSDDPFAFLRAPATDTYSSGKAEGPSAN